MADQDQKGITKVRILSELPVPSHMLEIMRLAKMPVQMDMLPPATMADSLHMPSKHLPTTPAVKHPLANLADFISGGRPEMNLSFIDLFKEGNGLSAEFDDVTGKQMNLFSKEEVPTPDSVWQILSDWKATLPVKKLGK